MTALFVAVVPACVGDSAVVTSDAGADATHGTTPNGQGCAGSSECSSGVCADGVCCDRACDGQCEACNGAGKVGTCGFVTGIPTAPRGACSGSGSCAGACDGTSKDCTYPTTGTICGASCDGKCDGAGNCSTNGGVCPNGYTCGAGGCKTSCTTDPDCQTPNFKCDTGTSTCKRVPESDCLDGKDNNGDGLIDCADPTCTAGYECVPAPVNGATLGMHITSGSCPTDYSTATAYHSGLTAGACSGCSCQTYFGATISLYGSSNTTCNGGSQTSIRPVGVNNSSICTNVTTGTYGSANITLVLPDHCVESGSGSQGAATWQTNDTFCAARTSATCGNANQVCVAKPPNAGSVCSSLPAGGSCPTGYTTTDGKTYYTGSSAGSCTCSTCLNATAANVTVASNIYQNSLCSGSQQLATSSGGCSQLSTSYTRSAVKTAFAVSNDNCVANYAKTQPTGTGGALFCCQ